MERCGAERETLGGILCVVGCEAERMAEVFLHVVCPADLLPCSPPARVGLMASFVGRLYCHSPERKVDLTEVKSSPARL